MSCFVNLCIVMNRLNIVHCWTFAKVELRVKSVHLICGRSAHGGIERNAELLVLNCCGEVLLALKFDEVRL
jgi:hypothetical protein